MTRAGQARDLREAAGSQELVRAHAIGSTGSRTAASREVIAARSRWYDASARVATRLSTPWRAVRRASLSWVARVLPGSSGAEGPSRVSGCAARSRPMRRPPT